MMRTRAVAALPRRWRPIAATSGRRSAPPGKAGDAADLARQHAGASRSAVRHRSPPRNGTIWASGSTWATAAAAPLDRGGSSRPVHRAPRPARASVPLPCGRHQGTSARG
jgi:hypothetical protein